jgi:ElaB/YqjD/DUF883 family membrane-anchored ribosome-binding protein
MTRSRNALAQDFDNVVSDAQELLKTIGDEGDARLDDAKKRMQDSLAVAKDRLVDLQLTVSDGDRAAPKATGGYAHDNPWPMMGAGMAAGVVAGYLLGRR